MKTISITSLLMAFIFFSPMSFAQTKAVDYLKIPGPINFDNKAYKLTWTSHPTSTYYKHEYIPQGDNVNQFKSMILLEVISGSANIKEIVAAKISELANLKKTNPVVNYESFENAATGEYILDFLLSQNTPDGKSIAIAEHNVYRYKLFTNTKGGKSILLFGVSTRSYGKDINPFLVALRKNKRKIVDNVSSFAIPAVTVN